jgi:hypothetical protein
LGPVSIVVWVQALLIEWKGVQPLGSSRGTSNGPDWQDIAEMIAAFEEQNHVSIEVSLSRWTTGDMPDLSVVGKAWEKGADRRVAKPLAFKNVICRAERVRTLEGVVTFLLYQMDFLLAEHEWDATQQKRA